MLLIFEDAEYAKIPSPKRTWVMNMMRSALSEVEDNPLLDEMKEYAFVIRGEYKTGWGKHKLQALLSLGLSQGEAMDPGVVTRHGTPAEAQAQGWDKSYLPPKRKRSIQDILMSDDDEPAPVKESPGEGQDIGTFG